MVVFQEHGRRAGFAAGLPAVAVGGAADVVRLARRRAVLPGGAGAVAGRRHRPHGL